MADHEDAPKTQIDAPAPLVDEALDAVRANADNQETVQDLKAQLAHLQTTLRDTSSEAIRSVTGKLRTKVRAQPIKATLAVGLLAFLCGITR